MSFILSIEHLQDGNSDESLKLHHCESFSIVLFHDMSYIYQLYFDYLYLEALEAKGNSFIELFHFDLTNCSFLICLQYIYCIQIQVFMSEDLRNRTTKTNLSNENIVFHLQQNQGTTIAKNYLLNENESLYKRYESRKNQQIRTNYNIIQSWHGQKLWNRDAQRNISREKQKNKKVMPYVKKNAINMNKKIYFKTQTDFEAIKTNNTLTFDQNAVRLSQSMMEWDFKSNNINLRNSLPQSLRSIRQNKVSSVSLKKYKLKKSNAEFQRNSENKLQIYVKNKGKQALSSQIIGENLEIAQNTVTNKLKPTNGLIGSILKKKVAKNMKTKFLKINKLNMNIEQYNKLQTNSPLKRQLNKLISLLEQQKNCKEIYNNLDD